MYERIVDIPENSSGDFSIGKKDNETILKKEPIGIIMQDSEQEYNEHSPLFEKAKGKVLIGGLGIGFAHHYLMKPEVTEVTIIENSSDVINLVWDHCVKDDRFKLLYADVEDFLVGQFYGTVPSWDVAWFDTWLTDNTKTHDEYKEHITNKFKHYCKWIGFWENSKQ
jgi:hypothetical protein